LRIAATSSEPTPSATAPAATCLLTIDDPRWAAFVFDHPLGLAYLRPAWTQMPAELRLPPVRRRRDHYTDYDDRILGD
jgi:hypothetical protein